MQESDNNMDSFCDMETREIEEQMMKHSKLFLSLYLILISIY